MLRTISLAGLALIIAGTMPALATTENEQWYGSCAVGTQRNDFTDKIEYHVLICQGERMGNFLSGQSTFLLTCGGKDAVALKAGLQFHIDEHIHVIYRWGKKKPVEGNWSWRSKGNALVRSDKTVDQFLDGMATTDRLIFQLGDEKGIVNIGEAERAAIPDLKARCGK